MRQRINPIKKMNRRECGGSFFTRLIDELSFSGLLVKNRNLELDDDAVTKVDRGLVFADLAERVFDGKLAALDRDAAVGLDGGENVGDADGAVKPLAVGRGGRNGEFEFLKLLGDFERGLLLFGGAGGALGLELFKTALGGFGGHRGETLREEIVAGVAGGDLDDLAGLAELLHVIHEHNFNSHFRTPFD